jgi:molybdate transport system regulatory protein
MTKPHKKILPAQGIHLNGRLWLEHDGHRFFGPGPVQLLELIEETGSISKAAKKMQMSYKKAWDIVNNLNNTATSPLVITVTGGENGGGSSISPEARELINWYKQLRQRFTLFLEAETRSAKNH